MCVNFLQCTIGVCKCSLPCRGPYKGPNPGQSCLCYWKTWSICYPPGITIASTVWHISRSCYTPCEHSDFTDWLTCAVPSPAIFIHWYPGSHLILQKNCANNGAQLDHLLTDWRTVGEDLWNSQRKDALWGENDVAVPCSSLWQAMTQIYMTKTELSEKMLVFFFFYRIFFPSDKW